MNKKRVTAVLSACVIAISSFAAFSGCSSNKEAKKTLRVFNCEDYICDDDTNNLLEKFEEEYDCKVEYSTFGTNENMYNELQINNGSYDLVCASDYMIMKMMKEGMIEKFDDSFLDKSNKENAYINNVSPYINNLFVENGWEQYAAGYMWGTMGFMYSSEIDSSQLSYFSSLMDKDEKNNFQFQNAFTLKDSVRDTYFLGVANVYHDELLQYKSQWENKTLDDKEYNEKVTEIMNRTDADTVLKVQNKLKEMKKVAYGFEVDSGKSDIVTGKIKVNFCWSGDAAFSIYEASTENNTTLYYTIPEEASNIWFDGWMIPKGADNKELAQEFLNFISRSENAIANMDYIGYTSCVATPEVLNWLMYGEYPEEEEEVEYTLIDADDIKTNKKVMGVFGNEYDYIEKDGKKIILNEIEDGLQDVTEEDDKLKGEYSNYYYSENEDGSYSYYYNTNTFDFEEITAEEEKERKDDLQFLPYGGFAVEDTFEKDGKTYGNIYSYYYDEENDTYYYVKSEEEVYYFDLNYLFYGDENEEDIEEPACFYARYSDAQGRLLAQYPTKEVVTRCAVMQYFEDTEENPANTRINMMWEEVKGASIPVGSIVFIVVVIAVLSGAYIFTKYGQDWFHTKPKKGYKKVK